MEWVKASKEKGELLESRVIGYRAQKRTMFGAPVYFVNGNMFAGVHGEDIFLRMSEQDRAHIADEHGQGTAFEPVKGRQMKEYVVVPPVVLRDVITLDKWIGDSYAYTAALPPKAAPKKAGKK